VNLIVERWSPGPRAERRLDGGAVHVWQVQVDDPVHDGQGYAALLDADEIARSRRLRFGHLRSRSWRCRRTTVASTSTRRTRTTAR
jgi:hypothetical protein